MTNSINFVSGSVYTSGWGNDVDATVYDGLVNVKLMGAIGNGVADDTTAIQNAFNEAGTTPNRGVYFPAGTYLISAKIIIGAAKGCILGQSPSAVLIKGNHAGILFEMQEGVSDYRIENLNFGGLNCTGIEAKDSLGVLRGYLIAATIRNCAFYWDLAYGINADCIFLRLSDSNFGGNGTIAQPAPGTSNMVGLRSHSISTNFTNHNSVTNCVFNCGNTTTKYAVDIAGGVVWNFTSCDFEQGGGAMLLDNVAVLLRRWVTSLTTVTSPTIRVMQSSCITPPQSLVVFQFRIARSV